MIPFEEAYHIVLDNLPAPRPVAAGLDETVGRVLARDVVADRDNPPFNRSAMDGYAVRAADVVETPVTLEIVENIPAGRMPTRRVGTGQCAKIMTGAPVPEGADAVVMVEHTEAAGDGNVSIGKAVSAGANICPLGENFRRGDTVLRAGTPIGAAQVAVMAAVGIVETSVFAAPSVAVFSTGSEIVPANAPLGPGQARDCNSHALPARLALEGIRAERRGIVPDDREAVSKAVAESLGADVLILSGGASMGDYDLVPGVLRALGVRLFFETVAMKPGKPTVFGRYGKTVVFGLPGNPVSVQATAELFVVPALRRMTGHADVGPRVVRAELTGPLKSKGDRRNHLPVVLARKGEGWAAAPVAYHGSGDMRGLARGNALAVLPIGVKRFDAGRVVEVVLLDGKEPW